MDQREEKLLSVINELAQRLPKFPDGRINYSNSKIAPVIIVFVRHEDKILALKRSNKVLAYKGMWSVVAGFLDEVKPIREKIIEELREELNIDEKDISSIHIGKSYEFNDEKIQRIWLRCPVVVDLKTRPEIRLNQENVSYKWVTQEEFKDLSLIPSTQTTLEHAFQ